jgi:hypothetical protein
MMFQRNIDAPQAGSFGNGAGFAFLLLVFLSL